MSKKVGLVLEGGGMRGIYTVGVLDLLLDYQIHTDYVIGVSAGACHGISYVSNQRGRSFKINTGYLDDPRYLSFKNYLKTKSIFGMDFIFDEIPNKLDLFDYDQFKSSNCEFVAGVTDVQTGKPVYFGKEHFDRDTTILRASSSIPVFAPIVEYHGGKYLDGGTSDPIPVRKAMEDGCDQVIVVLTRDRSYVKKPESFRMVYKRVFKKYPEMVRLLDERQKIYNETLRYIWKLEEENKAIVVAPTQPINISRFEKNIDVLKGLYDLGMRDASALLPVISKTMN
ncbi:patatin family protein [Bacillus sp. AGMB 02131]|uniref:Patatin family protein n=1 Tax=Peribacillus faecalis TaxID=2772559 RepID=A0A927CYU7_9BACI|nr:patatin family protein [Peribacillus faecalis]MBD3108445.1 patatin family protein [Peribacillus faecalis]